LNSFPSSKAISQRVVRNAPGENIQPHPVVVDLARPKERVIAASNRILVLVQERRERLVELEESSGARAIAITRMLDASTAVDLLTRV
jgi:hypothetical protein